MGQTIGCGMPSLLLPLTVDFIGLRMNSCLICSICSPVTDSLPVLFLLHTHPVSWNCAYHIRMELSDGGCFPNLVWNCRWTIVTDRHSWNVNTQNAFSLPFASIWVNCAPSEERRNYCTPHIIKENFEIFLIYRCNYILLSQVYCVWQDVKIPTIILNNPVYCVKLQDDRIWKNVESFCPGIFYILSITLVWRNWGKSHNICII